LQTEKWLARKAHEFPKYSGLRRMMLETKALKIKDNGILDANKQKVQQLKRRLQKFQY
jgi:hypothetical protein